MFWTFRTPSFFIQSKMEKALKEKYELLKEKAFTIIYGRDTVAGKLFDLILLVFILVSVFLAILLFLNSYKFIAFAVFLNLFKEVLDC